MKILWAKSDFLHPTTKGGHIRTLEMLKRLHSRHQIHYVALDLAEQAGGVERSSEYCTKAYPIPHSAPRRATPGFWRQACAGIFSPLPLAISRYRSDAMRRQMEALTRVENFDAIVCDFLFAAPNLPDLGAAVLFQHNVEALIWKRHAEYAASPIQRAYFRGQYEKMRRYEAQVCRAVERVIALAGHVGGRVLVWAGIGGTGGLGAIGSAFGLFALSEALAAYGEAKDWDWLKPRVMWPFLIAQTLIVAGTIWLAIWWSGVLT